MIDTNLHKPTSVIHREVFVFSVIPVIQADLNEFMRTQNCRNIHKSPEAPGGVPEMLFNLPAIVSFPKKGTNISKRDKKDDKEIYEPPMCYTKNNKLRIPSDPDECLSFYINILECLEKDNFPV